MRLPVASFLLALSPCVLTPAFLTAQRPGGAGGASDAPIPTIAAKTGSMTHMAGLLPLDWDAKTGKLYLEILHLDEKGHSADVLYTNSLPFGTGSNDLGLDRGQTAPGKIVHFERTGPKVLLVEPNEAFRGSTTDPMEQLVIHQSFPSSVIAGFTVAAEGPDGAVLIDATDFFLRDAHGVLETLTRLQQGAYKLDASRSTIFLDNTKAFPKNTEVEALLTFTTESAGGRRGGGSYVADVTPDAHAMTIHEHQSFLELPPPGFTPRRYDPRAGFFPTSYRDYSVPVSQGLDQQFIIRHRLIKKDPNCTKACEAVAPIHYYVDSGAEEPMRSALVEGARWWDQAFQAAGWAKGTFLVDPLPAGANPMDVRYNMIQWVHRYTRGWSYGAAITDPRTGEIIKGNVTLGSLRGRQDYMIATALLSPFVQGAKPITPENDPMLAMVLQRIRQLAAHETGHTLGLSHSYAASAFPHKNLDETMSVMEYPHPYIFLNKEGVPDLSHAYPVNIGIWDKVAINYGYREFDKAGKVQDDPAALSNILETSQKTGLLYLTDEDARPFGSASPHAHLWDNGTDDADELNRILEIRAVAIKRFGENAIKPGTPMAQLEDILVPLYLLHRYQAEAAIKIIGGLNYEYNLRGDNLSAPTIVDPEEQAKALAAVLKTVSPDTLTLPESLLAILPPRPPGLRKTQESFPSETGLTFDPIAAAESAADLTFQVLFDPARASRLVQYHMRSPKAPSLRGVLEAVSKTTAERPEGGHTMSSEVERAVEFRGLEWTFGLAVNPAASSQARAIAHSHIQTLLDQWTKEAAPTDTAEAIHRAAMVDRIKDFQRDPAKFVPAKQIEAPPGMPIGDDESF
jgi:hypothetical protein